MTRLTRRAAIAATMSAAVVPATALGQSTPDAEAGEARAVVEMVLGSDDAPVTVVEYASLTCPHCANFHSQVYPQLKENYIETGKVRFIVRDVYFDRLGLWASMVARCGGPERYFGIVDRLFQRQAEWSRAATAQDALEAIYAVGRQAGMTDEVMQACLQDQAWAEALVAEYQKNATADDVTATPTFFINGRKEANMSYADFAAKLDAEMDD